MILFCSARKGKKLTFALCHCHLVLVVDKSIFTLHWVPFKYFVEKDNYVTYMFATDIFMRSMTSSDESEDATDDEDKEDTFIDSYSDALNQELKSSTITKSFVRANEEPSKTNQVLSSCPVELQRVFVWQNLSII